MTVFTVNDGQWDLNNTKTGLAEIEQRIITRLLEFKGNCFFNTTAGVDYVNALSNIDLFNTIESQIGAIISNVYGVVEIVDVSVGTANNNTTLTINYTVTTIYSSNITNQLIV